MMLSRPPGPRSDLKLCLLMAVADGCQGFTLRRVGRCYEAVWLHDGTRYRGVPPRPGYVRRYADILGEFAHGRPGLGSQLARFLQRFGALTEHGSFDLPVGTEFIVGLDYRVTWQRGRVTELVVKLGECAALSSSGIAKAECDFAWHEPLDE